MLLRLLDNLFRRAPAASDPSPLAVDPEVTVSLLQALAAHTGGPMGEVISHSRQALAEEPDNAMTVEFARRLLINAQMPGERYLQVLRRMHDHLRPRTYVEIGVSEGNTIALVCPETLAIGVDPEPKIKCPLTARTRIFAETSDDFFARHDLAAELEGLPIDLAFIDGMHRYEFALRDFINLERHSSRRSTILVHDCYPLDAITAGRERGNDPWSGDVWKLVLCLKKYRPDLSIHTIGCAPTGLAVIRNLDPTSTALPARLQDICAEFIPLSFSAIEYRQAELLNLFPNEWGKICALLNPA